MSILDIILLLCSIPGLVRGFQKGFLNQILTSIAIILGIWATSLLIDTPTDIPTLITHSVVIVLTISIIAVLGLILEKHIKLNIQDKVDSILGCIFGAVTCTLICCILLNFFETINGIYFLVDPKGSILSDSSLYPIIQKITEVIWLN